MEQGNGWVVVVHCGAGWHNPNKRKIYKEYLINSCKEAAKILQTKTESEFPCCIDATQAAMQILENDPISNAGYGSTLNTKGEVEMDSSIMDSKTGGFGSVGGISTVINPSAVALHILKNSISLLPLGRIPPV